MKLPTKNVDIALLVLRLVVGIVFVYHGYAKVTGMEGTIGFFASLGFAPILAYAVAWIETLGGALMILGVGTRVIAPLFAVIMLVAIFMVKDGSFSKAELDIVLLGASIALFSAGSGAYAIPAFKSTTAVPVGTSATQQ